jgi:hypothetical protein
VTPCSLWTSAEFRLPSSIQPAIAALALLLLLLLLRPSGTSAFVLSMSHYVFFDCDDCCYQVSDRTELELIA